MSVAQQQGERWSTQNTLVEGGLYLDRDTLFQAEQMPGSARSLVNFEPSLDGGYHRILGYSKFDSAQLPHGASQVFGVVIAEFEASVTAMQGGDTYQSSGSGWTKINGADAHSGMGKVQHTSYTWSTSRFTWVDGDPNAYPIRIEAGGSYTILNTAPKGQKFVQEFSGYLWLSAGDSTLTFSAPQDDNDYDALDGAGSLNLGFNIVGMAPWRGALYVFGEQRIAQVTGTSAADWTVTLLTDKIGMTGPYSLQEVNGDLIFKASDGVRTISGTARIFDRELGVISRPISTLLVPFGNSNLTSTVIRTKSQYRLFQSTSSTPSENAPGIIGTLKLQSNGSVAWEWSTIEGIQVASADDGIFNSSELVVHGAWDGYVYQQESGTTFNGTAIQAIYTSPYLVFGDPNIRKILQKARVNIKTSGAVTVNLGLIFDTGVTSTLSPANVVISLGAGGWIWDGDMVWDDGTHFWDVFAEYTQVANLIGSGFNCSFSFTSSGGADYSITSWSVQWAQGARR